MRKILLGFITFWMSFSGLECIAQASKLPAEMPELTEIQFNSNGGMLYAFTNIVISKQTISVEEKNGDEREPRKWTAKIDKSDQVNLYKIFVENKFDTIKNYERKDIVYDAGSQSVSLSLGNGNSYNVSSGPNSPMSGSDQKRYQTIVGAIRALRASYEGKAQKPADFTVFDYKAKEHSWIFKNGQETKLSDDEIVLIKDLVKKAVNDHNSKQKTGNLTIEFSDYKFQFVPIINEKGEKEVWVNSFCGEFGNWKTQIVQVDDGGKCFFNLYINLTQKSYDRFSVNGYA